MGKYIINKIVIINNEQVSDKLIKTLDRQIVINK